MNRSAPSGEPSKGSLSRRRILRRAIAISIVFHIGLALFLLSKYLPAPVAGNPSQAAPQPTSAAPDESASSQRKPVPQPASAASVPPEQIEKSIESQIQQVEDLSDEQKLSELEKNLRRLDAIADDESIREVTTTIASTLGVDPQQYDKSEPESEGSFDFESAQLQDVVRSKSQAGSWKYESVLVDSRGRSMQVPMSNVEGETVYATFQQMKKYPFAEGIYRGVVMPLIQKMLEAEKLASEVPAESQRTDETTTASETDAS